MKKILIESDKDKYILRMDIVSFFKKKKRKKIYTYFYYKRSYKRNPKG